MSAGAAGGAAAPEEVAARAKRLHEQALVFDAHADTIAIDVLQGKRHLVDSGKGGHVDLQRLRAGGVRVQVFTLFVSPEVPTPFNALRALAILDALYAEKALAPDDLLLVRRASDIDDAVARRAIGVIVSLEGCEVLAGQISMLRTFYRLGVRAAGLTWNVRNELADGVGERRGAGLTAFGVEVVEEMNRLGMVVDVSHLAPAGFWDVMEVSRAPVMASHSNARALCDHPRNLADDQIRALARKGGVIGINFYPGFLRRDGPATLDDAVRHIDYLVELVGPDHVGLGSDFDGISVTPQGLEDPSRLPALTEALVRRGYDDGSIRKILGENFARLFRTVLGDGRGAPGSG
ncbi:dipeptidase [Carboxydochorda subterranea]|uniref:Dipeptidase n=1 Tax=Carboxydichorda subterranea TaxID=3109565 RepID=A0ABZ1BUW8_9FIRM|nr:dipeptidase [Limnochorda sp. L945t]WRP16448.1 dipeptidase [Limnochorda sp. L945t]